MKFVYLYILLTAISFMVVGQKTDANVFGDVKSNGEHLSFVYVFIQGKTIATSTDNTGHYMLVDLPEGEHILVAQMIGYETQTKKIKVTKGTTIEVNFDLKEVLNSINEVVISGTKTSKRKTDSPVIVNVLEGKMLNIIQATTLSEGLCFQPGLRVETDCQTCNYSQLRMNGLGGAYSLILVNSRPVFSPLTGLYGLEQIPANMVDRIEVVRGGGSVLYGSSAIGGIVNVITKIPDNNSYQVTSNHSWIGNGATDFQLNANANVLSPQRNSGMSFFASHRDRESYDQNGDNYSELPMLKNNSFGVTAFLKPTENQKIEFSISSLYEYRFGGEMSTKPAYLTQQSEERTHNVLMGGIDYEITFNEKSSLSAYAGAQSTKRNHYTGILPEPDDQPAYDNHLLNPPYGNTLNRSYQAGAQFNYKTDKFITGTNLFTIGTEYFYDDIVDEIDAYNYKLDQTTRTSGSFLQSDWNFARGLTFLSGIRADKHNLVDKLIVNPRLSLLYKYKNTSQLRVSWSTGFRAPQAFDADMHIAFAGGGISRIRLSDDLREERSNSFSASFNFDKPTERFIFGYTLEGFYTKLNNSFVLEEVGSDEFGVIYEKRNAASSLVRGLTVELRGNYSGKVQLEAGYTYQKSSYENPVRYSVVLPAVKHYLRSPDNYGYYTFTLTPKGKFNASISGVYTGKMEILHLAGAPENPVNDKYVTTRGFLENNVKLIYLTKVIRLNLGIEIFGGIKNIFNAYQDDFDSGKNRDSNYIYGPSAPRTYYFGIKFGSL